MHRFGEENAQGWAAWAAGPSPTAPKDQTQSTDDYLASADAEPILKKKWELMESARETFECLPWQREKDGRCVHLWPYTCSLPAFLVLESMIFENWVEGLSCYFCENL